ncbi:MAG: ferredoxin-thioredoxin reductase catalytic domain-containing protein [Elusimicrobiota bacterium]
MEEKDKFNREEKTIMQFAKKYSERSGYILNPDTEILNMVIKGLAKNKIKFGFQYCPCRIVEGDKEKDKDKICPCKWHKEEIERDGHCHCSLFFKK